MALPSVRPADDATFKPDGSERELPHFDATNLPDPDQFSEWRRTQTTWAAPVSGPFAVTTSEGVVVCEAGWLAIDAQRSPYPISAEVFGQTYEPAIPESELEPSEEVEVVTGTGETRRIDVSLPTAPSSEKLVGQLAHRVTFLEAAVGVLLVELKNRNIVPSDYAEALIAGADDLVASNTERATTPGRSGLVGLSLAEPSG